MFARIWLQSSTDLEGTIRKVTLVGAPVLFLIMMRMEPPEGLGRDGWCAAAVALLMALWWMSEAVPLAATALLPLVLFPALGVGTLEEVASSFAHPLVFLFLGGFFMARAMVKQNLSRRLAVSLLKVGSSSLGGIIASMMVATAFLSMWVSNTATTMMMLPIGQSIFLALREKAGDSHKSEIDTFSTALMLAIAYAATIGGMGTLIGTPPNALFAGFMSSAYGIEIEFWRWMMIGVPAVVILLPVTFVLITKIMFRFSVPGDLLSGDFLDAERAKLGPFTKAQFRVSVIISLAAFFWVFRDILQSLFPQLHLSDAGIAISAALLLFILPASHKKSSHEPDRLLTWEEARKIRWDVLILFGGGLALADAIKTTGLAIWIGGAASVLAFLPLFLFLVGIFFVIVLLGELASNTAVAAIFLPVAGAAAAGLGFDPTLLAMSIALAATVGFMLPVATPPNAIVYGSGAIKVRDMMKAGALLDVIAILVVAVLAMTLGPALFSGLG